MLSGKLQASTSGGRQGWDLADAVFDGGPVNTYYLGYQSGTETSITFKADGTKMYVLDSGNDAVFEYDLSTAWDVHTANYVQNFSVTSQATTPQGIFFKPDGTKMYITSGQPLPAAVHEYDLSSAWNINTASYLQKKSTTDLDPQGIFFKPDGTKMYVVGNSRDEVNEYSLSSAWDVTTASYVAYRTVTGSGSSPRGIFFKPDGTYFYITDSGSNVVARYNMTVAWGISAGSSTPSTFSTTTQENNPRGVFFKPDGIRMFVVGPSSASVWQYGLPSWNVGSAFYTNPSTDYTAVSNFYDIFFKPDGLMMFGIRNTEVSKYTLSSAWDIDTLAYSSVKSVSSEVSAGSGIFFKSDGTKMYVLDNGGNDVNEYDLSSAWDITTASYLQVFSVSSQDTSPSGIFFKSDGAKMYVVGYQNDSVYEYDLSSAWDISTASYLQTFSVVSQQAGPKSVFFRNNGTQMYVVGYSASTTYYSSVNQYTLSTPWDISSASYLQTFSVLAELPFPEGLSFKYDGTKMYINDTGAVWSYDL